MDIFDIRKQNILRFSYPHLVKKGKYNEEKCDVYRRRYTHILILMKIRKRIR